MSIHEQRLDGARRRRARAPSREVNLGDLEALQGVVKFPVRIKCATLSWNTLAQGLDEVEATRHAVVIGPPAPATPACGTGDGRQPALDRFVDGGTPCSRAGSSVPIPGAERRVGRLSSTNRGGKRIELLEMNDIPAAGPRLALRGSGASALGPCARTCSTCSKAERSSEIHSDSLRPTRRTHQARASLRLRATPASMKVSSTVRSFMRSRVITGTLAVVNCSVVHRSWRPRTPCAGIGAGRPRRCGPAAPGCPPGTARCGPTATWRVSAEASPPSSGAGRRPTTRISSLSKVTSGGEENQPSGSCPANQPSRAAR